MDDNIDAQDFFLLTGFISLSIIGIIAIFWWFKLKALFLIGGLVVGYCFRAVSERERWFKEDAKEPIEEEYKVGSWK